MRKGYQINEEQLSELEKALTEKENQKSYRRIQAVMLRGKGYSVKEIMEVTKFSQSTVTVLIRNYVKDGLKALISDKRSGNNRHMSLEEEVDFLNQFVKSSSEGKIVTVNEMYISYQKILGKQTNRSAFYRMLQRHGWRKVMPRPRHPKKAGAEEMEASKKLTSKFKMK